MEITDVTEFRIYVELARRKELFIANTQAEYDKYEPQGISAEIKHRFELNVQINKAKEELTELDDILDKLDDDSEYLYTQDDVGSEVQVHRNYKADDVDTFIIMQVTNYHGLTQLLINMED